MDSGMASLCNPVWLVWCEQHLAVVFAARQTQLGENSITPRCGWAKMLEQYRTVLVLRKMVVDVLMGVACSSSFLLS